MRTERKRTCDPAELIEKRANKGSFGSRGRHCLRNLTGDESGQGTVELVILLPLFLAVACVAVNVGTFLVRCAQFDNLAENYVFMAAASPASDTSIDEVCTEVRQSLEKVFAESNERCEVGVDSNGACLCFTAVYFYEPTFFGVEFSFANLIALPEAQHYCQFNYDVYSYGPFRYV